MKKCKNCGQELSDEELFCHKCGAKQDEVVANSNTIICKNCGAKINSRDTKCPNCGVEVYRESTNSAKEFERKYLETSNNEERVKLIEAYDIPRTTTDIIDFMTKAVALYNPDAYSYTNGDKSRINLSEAWVSKFSEAYNKALQSNEAHANSRLTKDIEKLNEEFQEKLERKESIKKENRKIVNEDRRKKYISKITIPLIVAVLLVGGALLFTNMQKEKKIKMATIDENMAALIKTVNDDISNGNLKDAKLNAILIKGDSEVSKDQASKYEKIKQDLLVVIDNKKRDNYNQEMLDIESEVKKNIELGNYDDARVLANKIVPNELSNSEDKTRFEAIREELLATIKKYEVELYSDTIDEYITEVNKLIAKKDYSKANDLVIKIVGNGYSSKENNAKWDQIRKELQEKIRKGQFVAEGNIKAGSNFTDLIELPYNIVEKTLKDAGFRKISFNKIEDLKIGFMKKDGQVESVSINGTTNFLKDDIFNKNDKVVITYHTFKEDEKPVETSTLKAGYTADDLIGKKYLDVKEKLTVQGFNNFELVEVPEGKDGVLGVGSNIDDVKEITIDGSTTFTKSTGFDKDARVIIKYYVLAPEKEIPIEPEISGIKMSKDSDKFVDDNYDDVRIIFSDLGFTNIELVAIEDGVDKTFGGNVDKVESVTINGKSFTKGDIFNESDDVVITYHVLSPTKPLAEGEIKIGLDSNKLVGEKFDKVLTKLQDAGFTNITTEEIPDAVDKFIGGNVGKVESVTINGVSDFSKDDTVKSNSNVVISYHVLP